MHRQSISYFHGEGILFFMRFFRAELSPFSEVDATLGWLENCFVQQIPDFVVSIFGVLMSVQYLGPTASVA